MKKKCIMRGRVWYGKYSPGCIGEAKYPSGWLTNKPGSKRWVRVPGNTCRIHYLESNFGLAALKCPKCSKTIQEETDIKLDVEETLTYIPIEMLFAPPAFGWFTGKSAFDIKCWHCGFKFYKKSRWTPTKDFLERSAQAVEWMRGSKNPELNLGPEDVK